jgi:hypothetical protein
LKKFPPQKWSKSFAAKIAPKRLLFISPYSRFGALENFVRTCFVRADFVQKRFVQMHFVQIHFVQIHFVSERILSEYVSSKRSLSEIVLS